jgi:hypothetical protein
VQDGGDALGLPIREQALHVTHAVLFALDEDRRVADLLLLLVDAGDVLVHHLGADLHVADRMIGEGFRIAFPDRDAVRHQAAHGGLEVVVAYHPAGDAGGAGRDPGLVDDQDVLAAALPALAQVLSKVPSGAEAVDAGADDDVFDVTWKGHGVRFPERMTGAPGTIATSKPVTNQFFKRHRNGFDWLLLDWR